MIYLPIWPFAVNPKPSDTMRKIGLAINGDFLVSNFVQIDSNGLSAYRPKEFTRFRLVSNQLFNVGPSEVSCGTLFKICNSIVCFVPISVMYLAFRQSPVVPKPSQAMCKVMFPFKANFDKPTEMKASDWKSISQLSFPRYLASLRAIVNQLPKFFGCDVI